MEHQGVRLQGSGAPFLYRQDPPGMSRDTRRRILEDVSELNQIHFDKTRDAEIQARIRQYELAYQMQTSIPAVADTSDESESTWERYGDSARELKSMRPIA